MYRRRNSELFARHVTGVAILVHNLNDELVFRIESGVACKMNDVEIAVPNRRRIYPRSQASAALPIALQQTLR